MKNIVFNLIYIFLSIGLIRDYSRAIGPAFSNRNNRFAYRFVLLTGILLLMGLYIYRFLFESIQLYESFLMFVIYMVLLSTICFLGRRLSTNGITKTVRKFFFDIGYSNELSPRKYRIIMIIYSLLFIPPIFFNLYFVLWR